MGHSSNILELAKTLGPWALVGGRRNSPRGLVSSLINHVLRTSFVHLRVCCSIHRGKLYRLTGRKNTSESPHRTSHLLTYPVSWLRLLIVFLRAASGRVASHRSSFRSAGHVLLQSTLYYASTTIEYIARALFSCDNGRKK